VKRSLIVWAVAGLVLRLAFALFYWTGQPLSHDEREYLALARSLARGDGFVYPADEPAPGTAQRFGRAPGYPVFLAALHDIEPHDAAPARVKIAQSIAGAFGVWLIGMIAARTGGPRAGTIAAAIAAVYPPLVWMPAYVLSETLYSTLALAAALLLDRAADAGGDLPPNGGSHTILDGPHARGRYGLAAASGVLVGVAILVRPAMVLFLPFVAAWLMWPSGRSGWRRPAVAAIVVCTALACVLPWTLRNARVYHRFVFVASEGGVTFWTGNHPLSRGEGDLAANPDLKRAELAFRDAHPGLTAEQLEPLYYRDAWQRIVAAPLWWLGLVARKAFYTIVPIGPSYTLHSAKYFAASAVSYGVLLPFAVAGAWRLRRAPHRPVALWLMAGATVAANLLFLPQERFRIPVIDPALIVTAAALGGALNAAHGRLGRHSDV
jgi:4-amino-4-deoxy-L-arabinose transferase-like glycosyltransferase